MLGQHDRPLGLRALVEPSGRTGGNRRRSADVDAGLKVKRERDAFAPLRMPCPTDRLRRYPDHRCRRRHAALTAQLPDL